LLADASLSLCNGTFVIARLDQRRWWHVLAQVFSTDDPKLGGEILVNTVTPNVKTQPVVTALACGGSSSAEPTTTVFRQRLWLRFSPPLVRKSGESKVLPDVADTDGGANSN
jgi:hypothetical protein